MTPPRAAAGLGAAFGYALFGDLLVRVALADTREVLWLFTLAVSPVWPALLLTAAALSPWTRTLAASAGTLALGQWLLVGYVFQSHSLWAARTLPLAALCIVAVLLPSGRERSLAHV